ncbi:septation regulator SpoVG [Acidaminobacter hydrogenoformans]|uniref:Putative septation protein SpoVG n=1 Tax=Acidaminobacter hydrogenoformans DSM 2784 TaxID=1120920 RepID=A0A1G5RPU2_9FIRM|nr:septation regulator SpoVG [Acidaminobacter hydrogenoformans]SCZ76145.1 stage V sporulation protein G [Acidaminobacter hydrogenoformans DSM 2784]
MKITDVRIRKLRDEGKMKAVVSVTLDDVFVVHDIKIIEGLSGLFVAMPSRKVGEGDYRDIAHPINQETRRMLQDVIFAEYDRAKSAEEFEEAEELTDH